MADAARELLAFEKELLSIPQGKAPVSDSKIKVLTDLALKSAHNHVAIAASVARFTQRTSKEFILGGVYVVDALVRLVPEKAARTRQEAVASKYPESFEVHLRDCYRALVSQANDKDKARGRRVLTLWAKYGSFPRPIISTLLHEFYQDSSLADSLLADSDKNGGVKDAPKPLLPNPVPTGRPDPLQSLLGTAPTAAPTGPPSVAPEVSAIVQAVAKHPGLGPMLSQYPALLPVVMQPGVLAAIPSIMAAGGPGAVHAFLQQRMGAMAAPQQAFHQPMAAPFPAHSPRDPRDPLNFDYDEDDRARRVEGQRLPLPPSNHLQSQPTFSHAHPNIPERAPSQPVTHDRYLQSHDRQHGYPPRDTHYDRAPPASQDSRDQYSGPPAPLAPPPPVLVDRSRPDPDIPADHIKVLSRTIYVGGLFPGPTDREGMLRAFMEQFGTIESIVVSATGPSAWVKFSSRSVAERVREELRPGAVLEDGTAIKIGWGHGFGPKETYNFQLGEVVYPIATLSDNDRRKLLEAKLGGFGCGPRGEIRGGVVVVEPDVVQYSQRNRRPSSPSGRFGNNNRPPPARYDGRGGDQGVPLERQWRDSRDDTHRRDADWPQRGRSRSPPAGHHASAPPPWHRG